MNLELRVIRLKITDEMKKAAARLSKTLAEEDRSERELHLLRELGSGISDETQDDKPQPDSSSSTTNVVDFSARRMPTTPKEILKALDDTMMLRDPGTGGGKPSNMVTITDLVHEGLGALAQQQIGTQVDTI